MKAEVLEKKVSRPWMQVVLESNVVQALVVCFSKVLGEKVGAVQSLRLLQALVACMMLLLFCGMGIGVCAMLLVWFGVSVYHCSVS